jgi:crossover junction endodeoxyribonuclease RuvC
MPRQLDASDALAAAVCHHFENRGMKKNGSSSSWKDFIRKNKDRIAD